MFRLSIIATTIGNEKNVDLFINAFTDFNINFPLELIILYQCGIYKLKNPRKENLTIEIINYKNKISLSQARNICVKKSKYEYVCVLDDDIIPGKDILESIKTVFINEKADLFCGRIMAGEDTPYLPQFKLTQAKLISFTSLNYFMGACHGFRKDLFDSQKIYDEDFGMGALYNSGEETDLLLKALSKKYKVIYDPNIYVYHPPVDNSLSSTKIYNYSLGYGALMKKHCKVLQKHLILIRIFFIPLAHHMLRAVFHVRKKEREVYFNIIKGFFLGFINYQKH